MVSQIFKGFSKPSGSSNRAYELMVEAHERRLFLVETPDCSAQNVVFIGLIHSDQNPGAPDLILSQLRNQLGDFRNREPGLPGQFERIPLHLERKNGIVFEKIPYCVNHLGSEESTSVYVLSMWIQQPKKMTRAQFTSLVDIMLRVSEIVFCAVEIFHGNSALCFDMETSVFKYFEEKLRNNVVLYHFGCGENSSKQACQLQTGPKPAIQAKLETCTLDCVSTCSGGAAPFETMVRKVVDELTMNASLEGLLSWGGKDFRECLGGHVRKFSSARYPYFADYVQPIANIIREGYQRPSAAQAVAAAATQKLSSMEEKYIAKYVNFFAASLQNEPTTKIALLQGYHQKASEVARSSIGTSSSRPEVYERFKSSMENMWNVLMETVAELKLWYSERQMAFAVETFGGAADTSKVQFPARTSNLLHLTLLSGFYKNKWDTGAKIRNSVASLKPKQGEHLQQQPEELLKTRNAWKEWSEANKSGTNDVVRSIFEAAIDVEYFEAELGHHLKLRHERLVAHVAIEKAKKDYVTQMTDFVERGPLDAAELQERHNQTCAEILSSRSSIDKVSSSIWQPIIGNQLPKELEAEFLGIQTINGKLLQDQIGRCQAASEAALARFDKLMEEAEDQNMYATDEARRAAIQTFREKLVMVSVGAQNPWLQKLRSQLDERYDRHEVNRKKVTPKPVFQERIIPLVPDSEFAESESGIQSATVLSNSGELSECEVAKNQLQEILEQVSALKLKVGLDGPLENWVQDRINEAQRFMNSPEATLPDVNACISKLQTIGNSLLQKN